MRTIRESISESSVCRLKKTLSLEKRAKTNRLELKDPKGKLSRDDGDVESRRATRFAPPALRLCISGCVCSTKRALLSVFVAPERRPPTPRTARSARNAPAHPSGRSSALLLRPFGSRIGCFSHPIFSFPFPFA